MTEYNTTQMKAAADEIRSLTAKFDAALTETSSIMAKMNWQDSVKDGFIEKYNQNFKVTGENLSKLMQTFGNGLTETAEQIDLKWNKALQAQNS